MPTICKTFTRIKTNHQYFISDPHFPLGRPSLLHPHYHDATFAHKFPRIVNVNAESGLLHQTHPHNLHFARLLRRAALWRHVWVLWRHVLVLWRNVLLLWRMRSVLRHHVLVFRCHVVVSWHYVGILWDHVLIWRCDVLIVWRHSLVFGGNFLILRHTWLVITAD